MFRGLINDAKSAAGSLIAKYLARASVAVSFIVALSFATAAITFMLVERFGAVMGSWIIAWGFTLIGLVATLVIAAKEQEEEVAEQKAEEADTAELAVDTAAQAAAQLSLALLGAILSTPMGPGTVAGGAKLMARNLPLLVLLAVISLLFWPTEAETQTVDTDEGVHTCRPDGTTQPRTPNGYHHEAAA
jgi:hypothetical protein